MKHCGSLTFAINHLFKSIIYRQARIKTLKLTTATIVHRTCRTAPAYAGSHFVVSPTYKGSNIVVSLTCLAHHSYRRVQQTLAPENNTASKTAGSYCIVTRLAY